MSTLRTVALVLLVVGLLGLLIPGFPAGDALKWAIGLALVAFIGDLLMSRKKV